MQNRLRDPIWQFVAVCWTIVGVLVAVLLSLASHFLATPVGSIVLGILIVPLLLLTVGLVVPVAAIREQVKEKVGAIVSTIKSFFRSTWGRRILAFGLLLGLMILEYVRSQFPLWPVMLFILSLQLLLFLGLVFQIIHAITSPVLVYDLVDKLGEATLRNESPREKIRPVERALSKCNGGTEMRAIYAHPGHPDENTEVKYQLPAKFAVARVLILVFAVAILGEHPVEKRDCRFREYSDNRAKFEVRVNGKTVFTRVFDVNDPHLFEWEDHVVPIAEVKGRTLKIDLITNAMGDPGYNWTAWGEPKLIAIF